MFPSQDARAIAVDRPSSGDCVQLCLSAVTYVLSKADTVQVRCWEVMAVFGRSSCSCLHTPFFLPRCLVMGVVTPTFTPQPSLPSTRLCERSDARGRGRSFTASSSSGSRRDGEEHVSQAMRLAAAAVADDGDDDGGWMLHTGCWGRQTGPGLA
jgi:hypothetical protein